MDFEKMRGQMISNLKTRGITYKNVLKAMSEVPREEFVPEDLKDRSYDDSPLPIGGGQTISQPYTVAFMLQALEVEKGQKILEIGTGSGYNCALLAKLVGSKGKVVSVEIIEDLFRNAKSILDRLKIKNVKLAVGDGNLGHEEEAPYDRIIVTAAAPSIREGWKNQLKDGGIILAPTGYGVQNMVRCRKIRGKIEEENLGLFQFVPLVKDDQTSPSRSLDF